MGASRALVGRAGGQQGPQQLHLEMHATQQPQPIAEPAALLPPAAYTLNFDAAKPSLRAWITRHDEYVSSRRIAECVLAFDGIVEGSEASVAFASSLCCMTRIHAYTGQIPVPEQSLARYLFRICIRTIAVMSIS